jgi:hypothetical protein
MSGDKTAPKQRGRPFLPGNTGNPNGRPPVAVCLTDTLRADGKALAEMRIGKKTIRGTNAELVSQRLWALARSGNIAAIKILYDRCDGLARATLEVQEAPQAIIRVIHVPSPYDEKGNRIAEPPPDEGGE